MSERLKKAKKQYLAPLFDRIAEGATTRLDEDGLKESIAKEASRILNTRLAYPLDEDDAMRDSTYPYAFGLDDFSHQALSNQPIMKEKICHLLRLYEPRLKSPEVTFFENDQKKAAIVIEVSGFMQLGERRVHFTFPVIMTPTT